MGGTQEVQKTTRGSYYLDRKCFLTFLREMKGMIGGQGISSFLWCFDTCAPVSNKSEGPGLSDLKWDCDIVWLPFQEAQDGFTSKNSTYNVIKTPCGSLEVFGFKNEIRQSFKENSMFQELGFMLQHKALRRQHGKCSSSYEDVINTFGPYKTVPKSYIFWRNKRWGGRPTGIQILAQYSWPWLGQNTYFSRPNVWLYNSIKRICISCVMKINHFMALKCHT